MREILYGVRTRDILGFLVSVLLWSIGTVSGFWVARLIYLQAGIPLMVDSVIVEVIGGLLTAIIIAVFGYFTGRYFERNRLLRKYQAAISTFSDNLGAAIRNSSSDVVADARIIVSIRDSSRNELSNVSRLLNSDIDRLSELITDAQRFSRSREPVPEDTRQQIEQTIKVLRGTWPAKKSQIDVAIRKLLAELGLIEESPT